MPGLRSYAIALLLAVMVCTSNTYAAPQWRVLPEAPVATGSRHDDVSFINEHTGWVCNLGGEIWRTTNGGASWVLQLDIPESFRSITFADSLRGWAGSLFDVNLLWETFDGGENWSVVPDIPEPRPSGICGLWAVDSNVTYGCGKYLGPATLIKTVNGGTSWTSIDMSAYATTLIDCFFVSPDSGFVVGGLGEFPADTVAIALSTGDGGATWSVRWQGTRFEEWGWKISFRNATDGVISLESSNGSNYYITTDDGGQTWTEHYVGFGGGYREQGIAFVSASLGWLGGYSGAAWQTTNGGLSWQQINWGHYLNRIFLLNSNLGYAVGQTVYKYSEDDVTDVADDPTIAPSLHGVLHSALHQNEPNPFNPTTIIRYFVGSDGIIRLQVYDVQGRLVRNLVDQIEQSGEHVILWDGRDIAGQPVASGIYFYRLESDSFSEVRKMTLVR